MVDTKKINKVMNSVQSVAKKSVKVFGAALPVATIAVNALDSAAKFPGNPGKALGNFVRKYTGVSLEDGSFSSKALLTGTGALVVSGLAGWAIRQMA